jgi:spermidine synthase
LRNQVLTLGEWGWIIGRKQPIETGALSQIKLEDLELKWLNKEALNGLSSFGKPLIDTTGIEVNTIFAPKLYLYYTEGNWDLY